MLNSVLVLKGTIELSSPAMIGSGRDDNTNIDVLLDSDGKPYIPATSFVGVLQHLIKLDEIDKLYENKLKNFWGDTNNKDKNENKIYKQSQIFVSDLNLKDDENNPIEIRDGIRIDNITGIVEKGSKYDYEIIKKGCKFPLNLEIHVKDDDDNFSKRLLKTIIDLLENEKVIIGGKTNSGFGKLKLQNPKTYLFDFSKKEHVYYWLEKDFNEKLLIKKFNEIPFNLGSKDFVIDASFSLENSLIIRSYSSDPKAPDATHITSNGENVITGTSLKGAIRARAEKILKTFDESKFDEDFKNLFGDVDDKNKSKNAIKGRILVEEVIFPKFVSEAQSRIKIDRFTGGTIETALFDSMPIFKDSTDNEIKNVKITIKNYKDYKDYEAGLLLLVLKDLWTGDIAIGGEKNVGRGILKGKEATISFNDKKITLDENFLSDDNEKLQGFVDALHKKMEEC